MDARRIYLPTSSREPARRAHGALPVALAALAFAGCGGQGEEGRHYVVRGQVRQLPDAASPGSGFVVAHEPIHDFADREGKVVGMDSMPMPFPVAEGVSLAGIEVSDVVEIDLRVDWEAEPAVEVVEVRELPAGTKLVFGAAEPGRDG